MPGRVFLSRPLAEIAAIFDADLALEEPGPQLDIEPGNMVPVLHKAQEMQLVEMRWGIVPVGRVDARGRPVLKTIINARSETVFEKTAYEGTLTCTLPVDGWYEWTGETRRKTRWRITADDEALLFFAAIYDVWQAPSGLKVVSCATLTREPNDDVRDYHHRMPVLLDQEDALSWIEGDRSLASKPPPVHLSVTEAGF